MSAVAAPPRRKAPKAIGRPASPILVTRTYAPDLRRQVEALLVLLRARPNDDDVRQPSREASKRTEGR